ncbi:unnamed protein product [Ambrosiozyma monospora]|uniref:Unnamed protein product n=1 Tax=Ambrosiozyma monospora TaxID=43982 RepID=A0ACB5SV77_AMBMO|nr:unnamed protein product [Ambrosiozyma monospora]
MEKESPERFKAYQENKKEKEKSLQPPRLNQSYPRELDELHGGCGMSLKSNILDVADAVRYYLETLNVKLEKILTDDKNKIRRFVPMDGVLSKAKSELVYFVSYQTITNNCQ